MSDENTVDLEEQAMLAGHAEIRGEPEKVEQPVEQAAEQPAEVPEQAPEQIAPHVPTLEERLAAIEANFPAVKQGLDSLAGRVGGINRTLQERLNQITTSPQATAAMKVTADKLKKLSADYPELAASLAEDLSEILSSVPRATAAPSLDPALVEEIKHSVLMETERKALGREHPNWEQDIALKDEMGRALRDPSGRYIPSQVFIEWLNSKPDTFKNAFMGGIDADFLSNGLKDFKAYRSARQGQVPAQPAPTASPASAAQAPGNKQARLAAAITPRGVSAPVGTASLSEDDAFVSGFKSVRG